MMRKNLFIFMLLLLPAGLHAQSKEGTITGTIKDDAGKPVVYANAVLVQSHDSTLVKGAITDENGKFVFEDIAAGSYNLMVAQVGYKRHAEPVSYDGNDMTLPPVTLEGGAVNLEEATIEAVKPFIEH